MTLLVQTDRTAKQPAERGLQLVGWIGTDEVWCRSLPVPLSILRLFSFLGFLVDTIVTFHSRSTSPANIDPVCYSLAWIDRTTPKKAVIAGSSPCVGRPTTLDGAAVVGTRAGTCNRLGQEATSTRPLKDSSCKRLGQEATSTRPSKRIVHLALSLSTPRHALALLVFISPNTLSF
jgi:hypothetical protein